MNSLSRSTALKIAATLSFLFGLWGLIQAFQIVMHGPEAITQANDSPPFMIGVITLVIVTVQLVAAYGTWKQQRWGIILTILMNALNIVAAAPGILFAPTNQLFIEATAGILVSIIVIVLCLWRDRKMVTA
jgi:hypothetical protein